MSLAGAGVSYAYGKALALSKVTVDLPQGDVTVLIGPNGSGKSTLLRCLAGALRPDSGFVTIDGVDLRSLKARQLAEQIAYVPQETPTPFAFTVEELIGLAPGLVGQAKESKTAAEAIEAMELEALLGRALTTLSGGERQRAAIARALTQNAPYLLLDEPTAHLDLRHQVRLFEALRRRAKRGVGVLIVLHELDAAARWADRILLMERGTLIASGPVSEILTADLLSRVYGIALHVERTSAGVRVSLPEKESHRKEFSPVDLMSA